MTISRAARALAASSALTRTALAMAGPAHASAQRATDRLGGAPTVGSCPTRAGPPAAARSDGSTTVDCTKPHTAQVAVVVRLPKRLKFSTAPNEQLFRVVAGRCAPK